MRRLVKRAEDLFRDTFARSSQVTRGAVLSMLLVGLGTVLGFLTQVIVSRAVGASEFGIYSYVLGLLGIARTVVSLSLDMASLRFVGKYFAAADWRLIKGFIQTSRRATVLVSLVGACVGLLVATAYASSMPQQLEHALVVGSILLVPTTLLSLEISFLQSFRLVLESRVPFSFVRPLVLILVMAVAIFALNVHGTAVLALFANLAGVVAALVISYLLVRQRLPAATEALAPAGERRQWREFCVVNLGQLILYQVLSQQADVVIVGSILSTTDAGYYAAASQIAAITMLGPITVNQYVAPMISEHGVSRDNPRLRSLLTRVQIINGATSLPLIAGVLLLGPMLLGLFGPTFTAAYPVVAIFLIAAVVNCLWGALWGDLLTMSGLYKESVVVIVTAVVLNLVLTIILTPRFGIVGAATATTAAVVIRSLMLAVIVYRKFGFWPWTGRRASAAA